MNTAMNSVHQTAADSFAAMRALNKMRTAGFSLRLEAGDLVVSPFSQLSEKQRTFIRNHKSALVVLLMDAETVYRALALAGPAGLTFHEGTPADWSDARLLAAGEVLYADGRMVNRNDRRYASESAPPPPPFHEYHPPDSTPDLANVIPIDREAYEERAAIMEYDAGLPRGEAEQKALALALRSAELQAAGWSPWNATARAESEALPEWEGTS